ncbi:reverse transcriptase domain-containing protein [Tanacetum coccineum]
MTTIRLVLSIVASENLHQEQLDVKTSFLHGDIDEDIYMTQREGFQLAGKEENLVCKLKKTRHGNKIKAQETVVSKIRDKAFSSAKQILGMSIIKDKTKGTLRLSHEKYIVKVLEKFNMKDVEARCQPLGDHFKLNDDPRPQLKIRMVKGKEIDDKILRSRDVHQRLTFPAARRDDQDGRNSLGKDFRKGDYRSSYKVRDKPSYGKPEITEHPYLPKGSTTNNPTQPGTFLRFLDEDKGHHTNDCIQLRKQLEIALESGRLNHLMKDLRQRVERRQNRNPPVQKVINTVNVHSSKKKKRKDRESTESWMNTPISCPPIMADDASDEPLIIEAEYNETRKRVLCVTKGIGGGHVRTLLREPSGENDKGRNAPRRRGPWMFTRQIIVNPSFQTNGHHWRKTLQRAVRATDKRFLKRNMEVFLGTCRHDWVPRRLPFDLKNAGATDQKTGIPRPSKPRSEDTPGETYAVEDMVIKSKEKENKSLVLDISKTFGKGYMVTSEGIRANPKKTKAISDLQSPKTLKEMQSLSGKLASLNRFLAKSAERALPFFNTLKNITKENKHEYRWTPEAEEAFQQMKRLIMSLPSLTPPFPEETLYAYLAVSTEAVSAVLLTDRNGRQCPVQYVSRTLNEAERNYSPLEKLALSLVNMTRRLRRYFEAHPVKVITDQPIKNILSRTEASGKLAKYAVEIGTYKISFMPRNAVKGQVLADFLSDAPDGEREDENLSESESLSGDRRHRGMDPFTPMG